MTDLKDHFSREATNDIESLFLISKSNCAFVNYKSEAACSEAMTRFHDSRFNGARLVCRLRRGSVSIAGPSPTSQLDDAAGPVPETEALSNSDSSVAHSEVVIASGSNLVDPIATDSTTGESAEDGGAVEAKPRVPEKIFIVKSLTLQDLESSVRNGVWATQSHNETTLNEAFEVSFTGGKICTSRELTSGQTADNVYLIFSANKSGEYFGYARMASPISGEAVVNSPPVRHIEVTDKSTDGPKSIPTPATEWAPKGRIVDDSARGTIFWEADAGANDEEVREAVEVAQRDNLADGATQGQGQGQDWGKPFHIEWISTSRLPFYRTRGLRNPWNANREVKIARDGTELEPSVGKRLLQMFHRPLVPVLPVLPVLPQGIAQMQSLFQPY